MHRQALAAECRWHGNRWRQPPSEAQREAGRKAAVRIDAARSEGRSRLTSEVESG
jgi:hypothetical protein